MNIKTALSRIVDHLDLSTDEMRDVMREIMTGQCTDAQIGAFMMAMRMKSESIDEIVGAVSVMRELADKVELKTLDGVVDVVGTGGDGANIFNVSTASSFVVAAAGCTVAKHGNRAVSGKSGSADLLEAAGLYLNLTPVQVARCIDNVGIGFMFAQTHHKAMKYAAGPRRDLGLRTLFNMLGPLTNPAGVKHQVVGVFTPGIVPAIGRSAATSGQQACAGGAFEGRSGRIQPGRADLCCRAEKRPDHRVLGRAGRSRHEEPEPARSGRSKARKLRWR
jgi:anthranilate phosphoribosyltransferase